MSTTRASEITRVIRDALSAHAGLARNAQTIAEDEDLYDAGLSSFATVNVMLAIEDAFDAEFPEHLLHRTTFSSITRLSKALAEFVALDRG